MGSACSHDSFAHRRSCHCGTQDPGADERALPGQGELEEARQQHAATAGANTRLFEEAQTRNTQLRATLEQQTATSDILRVIGSSPTDLQPVFDTIVQNAKRLLNGYTAGVHIIAGQEA